MVHVRLMSVTGEFKTIEEFDCKDTRDMLKRIEEVYSPQGFSNFKIIDDGDGDGGRITAKTPNGRSGRNVAFFDWGYEDE